MVASEKGVKYFTLLFGQQLKKGKGKDIVCYVCIRVSE